jgi:MoxR-like ATPase
MQEKAVTIAGQTYQLPHPFFVLATQNPIEQEGTYPLPEAQLDRFMFNITLDYPTFDQELKIVEQTTNDQIQPLSKVMSIAEIEVFQSLIRALPVPDNVLQEAVKIVSGSRPNTPQAKSIATHYLLWGAGPRASQNLIVGAKCHAALNGKFSPDIEDVHAVALQVLRHRLVKNYKAEAEGVSADDIIRGLL